MEWTSDAIKIADQQEEQFRLWLGMEAERLARDRGADVVAPYDLDLAMLQFPVLPILASRQK